MKYSNTLVFYYPFLSSSWNKKNTFFEEVKRPLIVQVFVDLCNVLFSLYRIRQRTKKVVLPYCLLPTWNICHQWMVTLSQTSEPKEYSWKKKKSIINVGISNCYSKRSMICWGIGFSIKTIMWKVIIQHHCLRAPQKAQDANRSRSF